MQKRIKEAVWKDLEKQKRLLQVELDRNLSMDEFLAILLEKYQLNKG